MSCWDCVEMGIYTILIPIEETMIQHDLFPGPYVWEHPGDSDVVPPEFMIYICRTSYFFLIGITWYYYSVL